MKSGPEKRLQKALLASTIKDFKLKRDTLKFKIGKKVKGYYCNAYLPDYKIVIVLEPRRVNRTDQAKSFTKWLDTKINIFRIPVYSIFKRPKAVMCSLLKHIRRIKYYKRKYPKYKLGIIYTHKTKFYPNNRSDTTVRFHRLRADFLHRLDKYGRQQGGLSAMLNDYDRSAN